MANLARGAENYRTVSIGIQYAYSLFSRILDSIRKYPNFNRITEDIYEAEKVRGNAKKNKVLAGEFILERGELVIILLLIITDSHQLHFLWDSLIRLRRLQ